MLRFVTINKYAMLSGQTVKAVQKMIERGELIEGVHYKRRPGSNRIFIDLLVVELWIAGSCLQVLKSTAKNYESHLFSIENDIEKY